jgi:autotransporter-associated beta strand protein
LKHTIFSLAVILAISEHCGLFSASSSWNVDSNGYWNKESNWSQNSGLNRIYPNGKDDVATFPAFKITAPRTISVDENFDLNSLLIDTSYKVTFSGGQFTIYDSIKASGKGGVDFDSNLVTPQNVKIFNTGDFVMSGTISGFGGITKQGIGTLFINHPNTYSGITDFQSGIIEAKGVNVFSPKSAFQISNTRGVVLVLNSYDNTVANLSGGGPLGGNIDLGSAVLTIGNDQNGIYKGAIFGTGGIKKVGSGSLVFQNSDQMTYSGITSIMDGTLKAEGDNAFSKNSIVAMKDSAKAFLDLNGYKISLPKVIGGGNVGGSILFNKGELTMGDDSNFSFAGCMSGEGNLIKVGSGKCRLTGTNTFTGKTILKEGGLDVSGLMNSSIEIEKGTIFSGNGVIVGNITNYGLVSLNNKEAPLVIHGDFTQTKNCKMDIKISSKKTEAIITTGKFIIEEGAILNFDLPMGLSSGSVIKIITAGEGIEGTFAETNLPENVKANLTAKSIILEIQ